ncbi:hypothetical protein [Desertihabitans brevis]|uniref:hypothetical protein n=1 Tax=Desertihabitans brevis TaxID=2268447 RepID=UPI0018F6C8E0|nr:hypothetical protein [Desertihabitans brevis]
MTLTTAPAPTRPPAGLWGATPWHRPLLAVAAACLVGAAVAGIGLVADPRLVTGAPLWAKPIKFFVSIALYALTLSWMLALVPRRRVLWWLGTLTALFLVVEQVIIVGAAVAGTTSHFNVSSPTAAALWGVMGTSITGLWVVALVFGVLLLRARIADPARAAALRAGLAVALVGMAEAFLMTSPTAHQLADPQGVIGAHTVGVADGGPGLPLLGWSTVAGDLRIGHFVGMHALQAVPLLLVALELAATRVAVLRSVRVRRDLVLVGAAAWLAVTGLLTWQALRGQSVVAPDAWTVLAAVAVGVVALGAAVGVLLRGRRSAEVDRVAGSVR